MEQPVASTRSERSRQITTVLAAHGLAAVTAGVRFSRPAKRARSRAEEAREACEELGTTFIKIGQLLSTRGDLLPGEFREELAKLQDAVPPLPADVIENEISNELGARPDELY
ncbi:MAG: AarF/ABC1/UbiB kinase family protein, partial [Candidatus Eremiobacteraeota bacterium]|nr:AarF/ABC1/UbiB kinase family protein [Candidatus Eremiobacteraeota bacterium]